MNVDASWMKPEMRMSVRVFDCSWTGELAGSAESLNKLVLSRLTIFPIHNRKFAIRDRPPQRILRLLQFLELHCKSSLSDLITWEPPQVAGETEEFACRDEPFRGIVLIPSDRIAIVHGELMVKVVVSFAHS